jgi:hypothetical protein
MYQIRQRCSRNAEADIGAQEITERHGAAQEQAPANDTSSTARHFVPNDFVITRTVPVWHLSDYTKTPKPGVFGRRRQTLGAAAVIAELPSGGFL